MANLVIDTTTRPGEFTVDLGVFAPATGRKTAHIAFPELSDIVLTDAADAVEVSFTTGKPAFYLTMDAGTSYAIVDTVNGAAPADNAALAAALLQFKGDPPLVRLFSQITTSATTANQSIISYTVPAGRTAYLCSYSVESISNDAMALGASGPVNIGVNPVAGSLGTIPTTPGTDGSKYFRQHRMGGASATDPKLVQQAFGTRPMIGAAGDVVVMMVTPSSNVSTTWTGTLELTLI